ncbi:hypothetical protein [Dyadobacter sp. 3J3]|uniref:hypothetical protein n=1 Tax=Dyadobacter sp. 3J3 TaxID=2606600 RepID=UPI0013567AA5|nr:hypothetical protein [Dyadobacter sp. 3J3]
MEIKNEAFRDLKPGSPEHRAVVVEALRNNNVDHLKALRGRSGKTIRIVTNWFFYNLITKDNIRPDVVIIFAPETREQMETFLNK